MKRLLNTIFALLLGINAYAMDMPMADVGKKRPSPEFESEPDAPIAQTERIEYLEGPAERKQRIDLAVQGLHAKASLASLPEELNQYILGFLETAKGFGKEKLYNAACNIRNFLMSSKNLSTYLADTKFNGSLIKKMVERYHTDPVATAIALHTKGAQEWLKNNKKTVLYSSLVTKHLIRALKESDPEVADWLEKIAEGTGLDVEYQDEDGWNVLMAAAYTNNIPLMHKILDQINSWENEDTARDEVLNERTNDEDQNALSFAAKNGNVEAMQLLLNAGAEIFWRTPSEFASALHEAVQSGNLDAVELLLTPDALEEINTQIKEIGTPLQIAALEKQTEIAKRLLEIPDIDLTGVLYEASPDLELMRLLIDKGADVNENGLENPLMGVIEKNKISDDATKKAVQLLIENGAELNEPNSVNATPVIMAVRSGKVQTLWLLLKKGAEISARDDEGRTALDYAKESTSSNKDEMIRILEEAQKKRTVDQ